MIPGILFIIGACSCWGAIFVIPTYMEGFGALEIALGRYFFFGLISLFLLATRRYLVQRKYWRFWPKALWFGFLSTIACYTGVVFCIQYANPAIAALIFGISPISIALYGNIYRKEYAFRSFALPLLLIALGLILVNLDAFQIGSTPLPTYCLGLFCGMLGVATWTWYTVDNFHFMEKSSQGELKLCPNEWVIMTGVSTLFLVLICAAFFACFTSNLSAYLTLTPQLKTFLLGSLIQGSLCTWLAYYLWNCGSLRLPIALSGQLSIFEMIFGLVFVYLCEQRFPLPLEITGILLMTFGVLAAFKTLQKVSPSPV